MKDLSHFETSAGIVFRDKNLLKQAFVHRSYVNEHQGLAVGHNERLEFLGDAVLELIVTDFLYREFPGQTEGELTAYRAALVNTGSLSRIGAELNMGDYLFLSKGEAKDTGRAREYILANTFEALVGAIFLDQGYDSAQDFVSRKLLPTLKEIIEKKLWQDAKSAFQEKAQDEDGITPSYKVLSESGPDHDKIFRVGVYIHNKLIAEGTGRSKQDAEQSAAQEGLKKKGW